MRVGGPGRWCALGVVFALVGVASQVRAQGATAPPQLSIAAASANEGNSGTTTMTFVVSASATAPTAMSVRYATSNGTAVAPGDWVQCIDCRTTGRDGDIECQRCLGAGWRYVGREVVASPRRW